MSDEKIDEDILKAIEKLERDSSLINQKKMVLIKSQKVIKPIVEESVEERVLTKGRELNRLIFEDVKFKAILGISLFIITFIFISSISTHQQFSFIEHFIIFLCCVGVVASK
jgi:hypothetical protein